MTVRNIETAPTLQTNGMGNGQKLTTKGDKVEAAIRGFLASGEIGPGEKISLRKLARRARRICDAGAQCRGKTAVRRRPGCRAGPRRARAEDDRRRSSGN